MSDTRMCHGSVVLANEIYVIGGIDEDDDYIDEVEVYDIQRNRWRDVSSLKTARCDFSCVVIQNSIYVIGGRSQYGLLDTIERYDHIIEVWCVVSIQVGSRVIHFIYYIIYMWIVELNFTLWFVSDLQIEMRLDVPWAGMATVIDKEWIYLIGGVVDADNKRTSRVVEINVIDLISKRLSSMREANCSFACVLSPNKW